MGGESAPATDLFVGRGPELTELRAALRSAAAGSGGVRLLAGEPGIGKTRLAREVAAAAAADGFVVGWGRTWEAGGAPPFWPWTRALRDLVRAHDADEVRQVLAAAPAVTALLPELGELVGQPAYGSTAGSVGADERFAVFEAVSTLLGELARRRPALLVLEDIHAADEPSLLLLQFVAADLRAASAVVLATFRDVGARQEESRAVRLAEVVREGVLLNLDGLDTVETTALLQSGLPAADHALVAHVQEATSGNPFFIEELIRLHRAGGRARGTPVPLGVRETVHSRLELLPADTYRVLVTAAVYGRSFDPQMLGRILQRTTEQVSDLLHPALEGALVVHEGKQLRFRHGLIREVLVDETPAAERARIHAQVVHVLENLPAIAQERHLSELAHHASLAVTDNAERAIVHARRAGDAAMRALAFEEAVRHYETALQVATLVSTDETAALDALTSLVRARAGAGDFAAARAAALEVRELASSAGSPQHLAQAALTYPSMTMAVWRVDEDHLGLLHEALTALGDDGDPATRARLLSTIVVESYFGREPMEQLAHQAMELADRSGNPLAIAQSRFASVYARRGQPCTRADLEQNPSVRLALLAGDTGLEAKVRLRDIGQWIEIGAVDRAETEILAYQGLVERARRPVDVWWAKVMHGMRLTYQGRYGEAGEAVQQAVDYGFRFAGEQALSVFGAQDYLLRLDRVPWDEITARLLALPDDFRQRMPVRCTLVRGHAEAGELERARDELAEIAAENYALLPRDRSRLSCLVQLAETAVLVRDDVRTEELLDLMTPYAGRLAIAPPFAIFGPMDLYRGRLLNLLGRTEQADVAYDAALRLCTRTDAGPFAARCRLHYGQALAERAEYERARELLLAAQDDARRLGMPLLEQAATAALEHAAPAVLVPGGPAAAAVQVHREGEYWSISSGNGTVRLRDIKGLRYLSRLICAPGREIHVLELASESAASRTAVVGDGTSLSADDLGPVLDERAKAEYRRRIAQLRQEIDEATELHDDGRAARAREEHDVFVAELSRALGLHGRDRRSGSMAEQARINVSKAVRTAIRRVQEQDAELGAELEASVRTGLFCAYLPLAGHRRWQVTAGT